MKILFLTDNFPPEVNAPATRTYEHCKSWVKRGAEVTVITCAPNFPQGKVYPGYKNKLFQKEIIDDIRVVRVWTYMTANERYFRRIIDYISYAVSAFWAGLFIKTDIIIATSPQFFTAAAGRWLSLFKRRSWIMEVRDLWPESLKNVGVGKDGALIIFFEWWEKRLYKTARHIIVVTDSFKQNISSKGIDPDKISVIKNGANLDLYKPRAKSVEIVDALGLTNKIVVGYIGTHGLAHKLDFILNCASKLRETKYHFLFIGDGAEKANLVGLKNSLTLENVTFLDSIEKHLVPDYLSVTDVSLIPLRKSDLFKTVIPSKIFETAAMEKPILLGVDGESRKIIEEYNAGIYYEPENEADFITKLDKIAMNKDFYNSCVGGCHKLAKAFDRQIHADKMLKIIESQVDQKTNKLPRRK